MAIGDFFRNKRVFVTGHTGFKGSWLSEWLLDLGAEVTGYSIDVPTTPSLFETLQHPTRLNHVVGDVRDSLALRAALAQARPQILFHLAAQPLVRLSYLEPLETLSTNVMGTACVLDAAREQPELGVLINVTSDKCYENREWVFSYRENDPLGGADPYSASKACAEIVFSAYARSFLVHTPIKAASVRAGNVIGGGDFATDRLIPDCVRAWSQSKAVTLRNPKSVRPWQHVLEPLGGYLALAARLGTPVSGQSLAGEAFNFGPDNDAFETVESVVRAFQRSWPSVRYEFLASESAEAQPHEARLLKLSCERARAELGYRPTLDFEQALELTAEWYRAFHAGTEDMRELTLGQIRHFATLNGTR